MSFLPEPSSSIPIHESCTKQIKLCFDGFEALEFSFKVLLARQEVPNSHPLATATIDGQFGTLTENVLQCMSMLCACSNRKEFPHFMRDLAELFGISGWVNPEAEQDSRYNNLKAHAIRAADLLAKNEAKARLRMAANPPQSDVDEIKYSQALDNMALVTGFLTCLQSHIETNQVRFDNPEEIVSPTRDDVYVLYSHYHKSMYQHAFFPYFVYLCKTHVTFLEWSKRILDHIVELDETRHAARWESALEIIKKIFMRTCWFVSSEENEDLLKAHKQKDEQDRHTVPTVMYVTHSDE